jgi:DNA repair exonuclease SbcCD nuclease subunit
MHIGDHNLPKNDIVKLGFIGDVHLSEKRPRSRIDDWRGTQSRKLQSIRKKCIEEKINYLIVAGDLFDVVKNSNAFEAFVISELLKFKPGIEIWVVPGNHDLPGNNLKFIEDSPLQVLKEAEVINILVDGVMMPGLSFDVSIYPWVYGEPKPEIESVIADESINIVVAHVPVYFDAPPPWHKSALSSKMIRNMYPQVDLIVSSDVHKDFVIDQIPRLINTGPIMRHHHDEEKQASLLWIAEINCGNKDIDIKTFKLNEDNVFTDEILKREKENDEKIDSFIKMFDKKVDVKLDYDSTLQDFIDKNDVNEQVREEISQIKYEVSNEQ